MKNIVFYAGHKETAPLSFKNYSKHGFSGTLSSLIEMAHALASAGHKVTVCNKSSEASECDGNLSYVSDTNGIDWATVDVLYTNAVTMASNHLANPFKALLPKLKKNTLVLIRFGVYMELAHDKKVIHKIASICKTNNLKLMFIPIAPAVEDYCRRNYKDIPTHKIQNAVSKDIFCQKSLTANKDKFGHYAFFPCWPRGGSAAERVARATNAVIHKPSANYKLGKHAMKQELDKCDYFVYPLVLPNGSVHHDTYGCVMHEAMACGVIVITWDIIGLRELYGDNIILLDPPPCKGYNPNATFGRNKEMLSGTSMRKFVKKINYLNTHPEEKEALREKAQRWALERTYDKVTPQLLKLIDEQCV